MKLKFEDIGDWWYGTEGADWVPILWLQFANKHRPERSKYEDSTPQLKDFLNDQQSSDTRKADGS